MTFILGEFINKLRNENNNNGVLIQLVYLRLLY